MLPKTGSHKEYIATKHRPAKTYHRPLPVSLPYFTQEELDLLSSQIRQHAKDNGIWGSDLVGFHDIKSFHRLIKVEPERQEVLNVPYTKLPLHINNYPDSGFYLSEWNLPVVKWRLQIGR